MRTTKLDLLSDPTKLNVDVGFIQLIDPKTKKGPLGIELSANDGTKAIRLFLSSVVWTVVVMELVKYIKADGKLDNPERLGRKLLGILEEEEQNVEEC